MIELKLYHGEHKKTAYIGRPTFGFRRYLSSCDSVVTMYKYIPVSSMTHLDDYTNRQFHSNDAMTRHGIQVNCHAKPKCLLALRGSMLATTTRSRPIGPILVHGLQLYQTLSPTLGVC